LEPETQDTSDTTSAYISNLEVLKHKIQPNLVQNVNEIGLIAGNSGDFSCFVLNAEGKLVFQTRLSAYKESLVYPFAGNLPAGMYRLVIAEKGHIEMHSFILAHE
jgi:hypothetical protein